uniref:sodium-dependent glucose transporter 1-like isoform X1 n=1 Tax=Styela clava TaxID=7725 RepID=UPI00193A2625|nr:sodium-dependent glucose transporter 1-like isoform X1 [Styela clava]
MEIFYKLTLITSICLARIGMGAFQSIFGPTLLYLADKVDSSVTNISMITSGKSIGRLFGSVIGAILKNMTGSDFKHLLLHGGGFFILGVLYLSIPWINNYWLLAVNYIIAGIFFGYLSTSLQAFVLQTWGAKSSATHIQLYHLMYTVGAIVTPLMAEPFLKGSSKTKPAEDSCPNSIINISIITTSAPNTSTTSSLPAGFDQTGMAYIIVASYLFFISILFAVISITSIPDKVRASISDRGYTAEQRMVEPFRNLIWFFLCVIGYFCFIVSDSGLFENYIYAVALCSELSFSVSQAAQIGSVFFIGNGLGRMSGVIVSNFVKPRNIILFGVFGSIIIMVLMSIMGQSLPWITWIVSVGLGYTTSMLFPAGVSWVSEITDISGKYMFVPEVGNAIGNLVMTPVGGYIFDIDPFSVVYMILGACVVTAIMFAFALCYGHLHKAAVVARANVEIENGNNCTTYGTFVAETDQQISGDIS